MNYNDISTLTMPEGVVKKIVDYKGRIVWKKPYDYILCSNGTQVIDTGVYCTDKMSCEIKMAYTAFPTSATYIGAIEYIDGSYRRCHFQAAYSGSNKVIGFWQDSPTMGNVISVSFDTNPHILIDGNTENHGNTPPPSNSTFYLFDRNVVGFTANAEAGKCKLYYAKFWEDGKLVRNFIPLPDKTGKVGLLDLVNNQFYFDLNGNDFTYELI